MSIASFGSTTFRREDIQQGFEADSSFYIRNESRIRGKEQLDLRVDPPPGLAVEIGITSSSIEKLSIYAQFGVPEVWRYDGLRLEILLLQADRYVHSETSLALPRVRAVALARLLEENDSLSPIGWMRRLRAWARELGEANGVSA